MAGAPPGFNRYRRKVVRKRLDRADRPNMTPYELSCGHVVHREKHDAVVAYCEHCKARDPKP